MLKGGKQGRGLQSLLLLQIAALAVNSDTSISLVAPSVLSQTTITISVSFPLLSMVRVIIKTLCGLGSIRHIRRGSGGEEKKKAFPRSGFARVNKYDFILSAVRESIFIIPYLIPLSSTAC